LSSQNGDICFQQYLPLKLSIRKHLKQNAVDYRSHLTIENNLKVEKKVDSFENKHNFPPSKKTLGVRVETSIPKKLESNNYAGTLPGRCLLHHKGIENDQTIFFTSYT